MSTYNTWTQALTFSGQSSQSATIATGYENILVSLGDLFVSTSSAPFEGLATLTFYNHSDMADEHIIYIANLQLAYNSLNGAATAGSNSITLTSAAGFAPYNKILISADSTPNPSERRRIAAGGVSGNTLTLQDDLVSNHASGAIVANLAEFTGIDLEDASTQSNIYVTVSFPTTVTLTLTLEIFGIPVVATAGSVSNVNNTLVQRDGSGNINVSTVNSTGVVVSGGQSYDVIPSTTTPTGTTATINWNNGNVQVLSLASATGNVAVTMTNGQNGAEYTLYVIQGSNGYNAIFPGVLWPNGVALSVTSTSGVTNIVTFSVEGSNYYGDVNETYGLAQVANMESFASAGSTTPYVNLGATALNSVFGQTTPWSVSAWVYYSTTSPCIVLSSFSITGGNGPGMFIGLINSGTVAVQYTNEVGGTPSETTLIYIQAATTFAPNTWNHIVVTYNGNSSYTGMGLYINGAAQSYQANPFYHSISGSPISTGPMYIGYGMLSLPIHLMEIYLVFLFGIRF
jgi:hypothetical protein